MEVLTHPLNGILTQSTELHTAKAQNPEVGRSPEKLALHPIQKQVAFHLPAHALSNTKPTWGKWLHLGKCLTPIPKVRS